MELLNQHKSQFHLVKVLTNGCTWHTTWHITWRKSIYKWMHTNQGILEKGSLLWLKVNRLCHIRLYKLGNVHLTSRGGGAIVFWGKTFSVCKFPWNNVSVSEMGRKKYCFYRKKIMSRQHVVKKNFCCAAKRKKIFWLRKKP